MKNLYILILAVNFLTFNSCNPHWKLGFFEGEWRLEKLTKRGGAELIPFEGEVTLEIVEDELKGFIDDKFVYKAKLDILETELYAEYLIVDKKCLEEGGEVFLALSGKMDFYREDKGFNIIKTNSEGQSSDRHVYFFVEK